MSRDELLEDLAKDKKLDSAIMNLCSKNQYLYEEGKQELFLVLCQLPEERLLTLHESNELFPFILGILSKFFHSERSTFYNKIKKFPKLCNQIPEKDLEDDKDNLTELVKQEQLTACIKELNKFDKDMIKLYLELGAYRKVARKLKIHEDSIRRSVKRIVAELKTKLENELSTC